MAVTDTLTTLWDEKKQRDAAFQVRALLQAMRDDLANTNARIQAVVDSGQFDTIPADVKAALAAGWNAVKAAHDALTTGDTADVLDWTS